MKVRFQWPVLLVAVSTLRAAAPAWVTAAGQAAVPGNHNAAVVLQEDNVTYLTADRLRHRARYAYRLWAETARLGAWYRYPYNPDTSKILSANAWIVAAATGKIRSFRRAEFLDAAAGTHVMWNHNRVLAFNGTDKLTPGDTLVCEVESEDPAGAVEVQESFKRTLYTLSQTFEVAPPPGMNLVWHATSASLPDPIPGSAPGSLRWVAKSHGVPRDQEVPRAFLANPEVILARPEAPGRPVTWNGLSQLAGTIIDPQIDLSAPVKAEAARLIAGRGARWERIRALTEFVQSQIVYLSLTDNTDQLAGCRPHRSEEVLSNRFGDCKDKAALLVALLRSIGEDGRVLLVTLGDPRAVNPDWPSLNFNHAIAAIPADADAPAVWPRIDAGPLGSLIVFDPTDSTTPLGVLGPFDQGGWALLVDAAHGKLVRLPEAEGPAHSVESRAEATLGGDGEMKAVVDKEWHGVSAAEAYAFRAASRTDKLADHYTQQLRETVPFIRNFNWKDHWDPANADFRLHLEFEADRYGRHVGSDLLAISPRIGSGIVDFPEWKTGREGVSWLWTGEIHWRVKLKIPSGFAVEELPEDWDSVGATVSSHLKYSHTEDAVIYESRFSIRPGFYPQARYEAIRLFVVKFHEAERRPILLRRKAAAETHS